MAQQKDAKTGKWMYYGSYVDAQGKRRQYKKRGFDTKREARRAEDEFRDQIYHPEVYLTVASLCDRYNAHIAKWVKKSTIKANNYSFARICKDLGDKPVAQLDKQMLQAYIDELDAK